MAGATNRVFSDATFGSKGTGHKTEVVIMCGNMEQQTIKFRNGFKVRLGIINYVGRRINANQIPTHVGFHWPYSYSLRHKLSYLDRL